MTPLNHPERKKAFTSFIIFFAITVAIVVATVLFSVQVPFKQNDQLREQLAAVQKEQEFNVNFTGILDTTVSGLKAVVLPENRGSRADVIDGKIANNINELNKLVDNEKAISNRNFYNLILDVLTDLRTSKKDARDLSELQAQLKDLKESQRAGANYIPQIQPSYPPQQ